MTNYLFRIAFLLAAILLCTPPAHALRIAYVDPCQAGMYAGPECRGSSAYVPPAAVEVPANESGGKRLPNVTDAPATTEPVNTNPTPKIHLPDTPALPATAFTASTQSPHTTSLHAAAPIMPQTGLPPLPLVAVTLAAVIIAFRPYFLFPSVRHAEE